MDQTVDNELVKINEYITLIRDPDDWVQYMEELTNYKAREHRHFGLPYKFPCLVISIEEVDDPFYYWEHRFVYADAARTLVNMDNSLNSRFSKILSEK